MVILNTYRVVGSTESEFSSILISLPLTSIGLPLASDKYTTANKYAGSLEALIALKSYLPFESAKIGILCPIRFVPPNLTSSSKIPVSLFSWASMYLKLYSPIVASLEPLIPLPSKLLEFFSTKYITDLYEDVA